MENKETKERLKAEKVQANREKRFEAAATMGSMLPVWQDKSLRLKTRMTEVVRDCRKQLEDLDADVDARESLDSAYKTLKLRTTMLATMLGDSCGGDPVADNEAWHRFVG